MERTFSCSMSCEKTYRCLVDVVHVGGSSAACPEGVLAQRERRYCPAQGRTLAPSSQGFIAGAGHYLVPPRADPCPPPCVCASPCVHERVCVCVCLRVSVYVCHLANLSQSPGSDKNAAALVRAGGGGHTLEWNEVCVRVRGWLVGCV